MTDFYGLTEDEIVSRVESGETLTQIATDRGKARSMLTRWVASDEQRSARVVRARQLAASAWEESAENEIRQAEGPFELAKAKELAHHFRWRASKIAPKEYGDKIDLTVENRSTVKELSDDELVRIARGGGAGAAVETGGEEKPTSLH